jgi:hypothetical protein
MGGEARDVHHIYFHRWAKESKCIRRLKYVYQLRPVGRRPPTTDTNDMQQVSRLWHYSNEIIFDLIINPDSQIGLVHSALVLVSIAQNKPGMTISISITNIYCTEYCSS